MSSSNFSQVLRHKKLSSRLRTDLIVKIVKSVQFCSSYLFSSFKETISQTKVDAVSFIILNNSIARKHKFCFGIETEPSLSHSS